MHKGYLILRDGRGQPLNSQLGSNVDEIRPGYLEAYTAVLPWYERADFQRMWELAHDRDDMPSSYEVWHASARAVMTDWLSCGRALQIITIRPDEFLAWLKARGLINTAASRLKYVEQRARGAGISQPVDVGATIAPPAESTAA
jgi:hypothetical protein